MYELATDADVPALVALINRAYRGNIGSGWSTEEAYLVGDRTTDALLRDDLAKKPAASLLKWQEVGEADIIGCVWLEPVGGSSGIWVRSRLILGNRMTASVEPGSRPPKIGLAIKAPSVFACRSRMFAKP
jgi:hypothetical protein